jgi:tetratricopeptide (TPR) repeat protein
MVKILEIVKKYLLYVLIVLYPIFVFSFATTTYVLPKEILLAVLTGLAVIVWVAEAVVKRSLSFKVGRFDLPILLVVASYVVSGIVATPNKMEAFFYPGVATVVATSAVLYFVINQLDAKSKEGIPFAIIVSGILLSIIGLFAQVGVLGRVSQLPSFVKATTFNPMGGSLPAIIYLAVVLVVTGEFIYRQKDLVYRLFAGVAAAVVILGLVVLVKNSLPGQSQGLALPDFSTSWQISVETIKASPLWGVGPANYLTAFGRFRPVTYNATDLWQIRFTTATDFYLTVLTELGFAGAIAFAVLIFAVYKAVAKKFDVKFLPAIVLLVLFAALPIAPVLLTVLFVLLAVVSESENKNANILGESSAKSAVILICLPILVGLGLFYFVGTKWVLAEITYSKSIDALAKNDAKNTYNLMTQAINQNTQIDRYHASLAQIDMLLAGALAGKKDLTDNDKSAITQLVQQAINEGKSTVVLNPARSGNWEVLAQIYRGIMTFATGADQFAIQTYAQAVVLDPTDPNLRIALGGVYYALGRYDDSIGVLKLAVLAKPDLANAHYNLSAAYAAKKDYDNAITEINTVISLVPNKDSQDYKLAQSALSDLEKNKPAPSKTTTGQNLTAPQPAAPFNVTPPIALPKEATPPATTQ